MPIQRLIRIVEAAAGVSVIITLPVFHARALLQKIGGSIRWLPQIGSAKRKRRKRNKSGKDGEGNKHRKPPKQDGLAAKERNMRTQVRADASMSACIEAAVARRHPPPSINHPS
jgi:hypothetical protein